MFDIGMMGNPDAQGLEGLDDTYMLNITDGTMMHEDAYCGPYHSYIFWFYLSFTVLVFFVLLNLLQGVLVEEYSSAKKVARPRFLRLRAQMIVNLLLLRECLGFERSWPEAIMFVYENRDKAECALEHVQAEPELSRIDHHDADSSMLPVLGGHSPAASSAPVPSHAPMPSNAHWSNSTREMALQFHDGAQHYQFGSHFSHQGATPFNIQGVSSLHSAAHHLTANFHQSNFHQSGRNVFPSNGVHMA